jgi:hypothetical protein
MRPLEEEKSIGNETGTFPFGRESNPAEFARQSKEKMMNSRPETEDEEGKTFILVSINIKSDELQEILQNQQKRMNKRSEMEAEDFENSENDEIIMIGSSRRPAETYNYESQYINESKFTIFIFRA